jgi:serine/threonine protein kinase
MTTETRPRLGKYDILQTLGAGAMGVVYLAYDAAIERKVAVKTIRKEALGQAGSAEVAARFRREAMAAGRLTHPGIVAVYDYGEDDSVAYIVMEYAPGQDLGRYAASRDLSLSEVLGLMAQLLDALGFAHAAGVVHRDVKPGNILVGDRLKITDFGIARVADSSLTQTGVAMGTPAYMAPEQYMGIAVDYRIDLFAAGVVLYELLTKALPFDGKSLEELSYKVCHTEPKPATLVRPDLPRSIDIVLARALAKSSAARYSSAAELSRAITDALSGVELEPSPHSRHSHAGGPRSASLPPPSSTTLEGVSVSPEAVARVTQTLATYVGPIAKVMVKKATADAPSYLDLCLRVSARLETEDEKTRFLKEVGVR